MTSVADAGGKGERPVDIAAPLAELDRLRRHGERRSGAGKRRLSRNRRRC
jgi:hypothetical protein